MKQAFPMDVEPRFDAGIDVLLVPVPGCEEGAGASLRYDPLYQQIREARHQDDASVPMGEWERPLVKADWKRVAALSADALATRSKDFQLAAWLCEAWANLHGVEGLTAGTRLLTALAERYWSSAWPMLEAGDADARVAPFVWLNDTLALVLTLHVPLLVIDEREPAQVNLDEWQRAVLDGGDAGAADLTRDLLDKHVKRGDNLPALVSLYQQLELARAAWGKFRHLLDELLQDDSPHLGRVDDVLMRLTRAVTSLCGNQAPSAAPQASAADDAGQNLAGASSAVSHPASTENTMSNATPDLPSPTAPVRSLPARVESRAQAYQLLELVAGYLAEHEPHSPTPYLLRRAVSWGEMSLPELMREVVRTEGDMSRFYAMLGLE
ncbi:type VI secretion system protein TssA [Paraburkholderia lycopersici]|uniref:Type VI secretion system protein ImpA n=1 Tax=Paraburkholderia lycopersici TaxID=416944 RepID=A0A1G6W7E6_9BURK|nr:type VI secretion system protein TssA [Paraburkholderia lycopersici]SDD61751.1 type VI secretion system protein ImpA [Paraburkholderia lycopersici]